MKPEAPALADYRRRLAFDEELRGDSRYQIGYVDEELVARLRDGIAGVSRTISSRR
jgi:hypothetical protein